MEKREKGFQNVGESTWNGTKAPERLHRPGMQNIDVGVKTEVDLSR